MTLASITVGLISVGMLYKNKPIKILIAGIIFSIIVVFNLYLMQLILSYFKIETSWLNILALYGVWMLGWNSISRIREKISKND